MADEGQEKNNQQGAAAGATPEFDYEKMRGMMREEFQQFISTEDKDGTAARYEPPARPTATENPLAAVINPIVQPALATAILAAHDAKDAAIFYQTHPEAGKHQADIEKAFNALVQQGTPFTREAVWAWYRGNNFDKFLQEARQADQQKVEDAKNVQEGNTGFRVPGGQGPLKDAFAATDDELKSALNGVTF